MKYPHMFAPLEIRGVRLKNRILALELPDRILDDGSGELTQSLIDNYEMLARGGAAAVTVAQELMQGNFFVDPVPQALTLTSIVIGACVDAMALSLVIKIYRKYHTIDSTEVRRLHG